MFLHDGFSFRWERANALLAHLLAYVSTHCLINAVPGQVPGSLARPCHGGGAGRHAARLVPPIELWRCIFGDCVVSNATATVIAFSNGHASIYLSTGGGFIGGGESVRNAAKKMVAIAAESPTR
jgi:hypothetical protein